MTPPKAQIALFLKPSNEFILRPLHFQLVFVTGRMMLSFVFQTRRWKDSESQGGCPPPAQAPRLRPQQPWGPAVQRLPTRVLGL